MDLRMDKGQMLHVLTFTSLFPNTQQPLHGLFVRERIKQLARLCDLRVIAPVPWAPQVRRLGERYYQYSQVAREEYQDHLTVRHPRFVVIPRAFKASDGLLMAACSLRPLKVLRRTFPFEIIDAHWAYPDGVAAAILAQVFRIPLAITVRGDDINIFAREFWRRQLIRFALQRSALVIALSEELKQRVESLGVPSSRVVVIANGIDTKRFYPLDRLVARRHLGLEPNSRLLLSVGRLHTSKGYPILVEAFARLQTDYPQLRLAIVGSVDPEANAYPAIQRTAVQYGVSNKVDLVGPQPPDRLLHWYGAADLFCLPTFREGSANVLLEALACGLPCITTPVGGNPGTISSSGLGLLVPPKAEAFAAAIDLGLRRTWDREWIARHTRMRSWDVVAKECYVQLSQLVNVPIKRDA
jgi:glycosyltransferase involved in cell wall biosynthesis